jgi:hypothetical protein
MCPYLESGHMCVLVVHLDSQAKVSHLGNAATLAAAVTLQQHIAHLQVAVDDLHHTTRHTTSCYQE